MTGQADRPALRVLLVDDEQHILDFLRLGLSYEGFETRECTDGRHAIDIAAEFKPDMVILDVMLPGLDGVDVCKRLRSTGDVGILMLTARADAQTAVAALDLGADDYVVKPFDFKVLVARIRSVLRRRGKSQQDLLVVGDLTLNRMTRDVQRAGARIELTPTEFDLLEMFMAHPRQVFSREVILNRVWGFDYTGGANVVDVYVSYLRQKLARQPGRPVEGGDDGESDSGPNRLIHTVRGVGFTLRLD